MKIHLHIVEPYGCSIKDNSFVEHNIQGFAVGRKPSFLNEDRVASYIKVTEEQAFGGCQSLRKEYGLHCGPSSGANFFACNEIFQIAENGERVLSLLYDRGEDYQ